MARTILNQSTQVSNSYNYTSVAPAGATLQTGALTIQDDLNALRVQVSRILDATQTTTNWYDDIATVDAKKRGILQLNTGLDAIETKTILENVTVSGSVSIPSGQNYVLLSVANNQAPTMPIALGAKSLGVVVAQSANSGTAFAASELAVQAGSDAQNPKNRCTIVDATTRNVIEYQDADVFGLLQVESTAADGGSFNDTVSGARAKLTLVYFDAASNAIKAVPANALSNTALRYSYNLRTTFANLPEDAFSRDSNFTDQVASVDVQLTRATANQLGAPIPVAQDVSWRVANGINFRIANSTGSKDLFLITPSASGNAGAISTDTLALSTTAPVTSVKGASLATGGQAINLGVTTGQLDTTGPLAVRTLGSNTLTLNSGGSLLFTDAYQSGSTWTSAGPVLSSATADWSGYKAIYGEASLMAALIKASQSSSHGMKSATVTASTISAGTIVSGAANLSAYLYDYSKTQNPASNVKVLVNGVVMQPGGEDYSLAGDATKGELTFTFPLRGGTQPDRVTMEVFGDPKDV